MVSLDGSQSSELAQTQYPSQSSAFQDQRIWVSPEFENSLDLYQWIVQSHGAELVPEPGERDVFHLLPKFQGETYARLAEAGLRIVAVPCLAASVKHRVPLPVVEDESEPSRYVPIFSRALEGQTVCTSHLNGALRKNIRTMVLLSNGQYQSTLDDNTTLLITKRIAGEKYLDAARRGIPIVTPAWIRDCFRQSKMLEPQDYLVPCFTQLTFCATKFENTEREKLKNQVLSHGALWSASLNKTCTHLIINIDDADTTSPKLKYALQWNLKVVSQYWVQACITHGSYCPIDDTTAHLTAQQDAEEDRKTKESLDGTNQPDNPLLPSNGSFEMPLSDSAFLAKQPVGAQSSAKGETLSEIEHTASIFPQETSSPSIQLSNVSDYIGHTPYRRVSLRQSHLDLRPSILRSRSTDSPNQEGDEEDDLEGDKPDEVDPDSEEELDEIVGSSKPSLLLDLSTSLAPPDRAHASSSSAINPIPDSVGAGKSENRELFPRLSEPFADAAPVRTAPPRSEALYHGLDRNTQDALVTEALDLYFQPGVTITSAPDEDFIGIDAKDMGFTSDLGHEEQKKDDLMSLGTMQSNAPSSILDSALQSSDHFKGNIITIVGVPDEPEDNTTRQRKEELEDAVEEFERCGGALSLDFEESNIVLVFDTSLLKPEECMILSEKVVVSSDWLTDSVLLQLCQPIENFHLAYSESSQKFVPKANKFWTSSCVVETNPASLPHPGTATTSQGSQIKSVTQESHPAPQGATGISTKLAIAPSLKPASPLLPRPSEPANSRHFEPSTISVSGKPVKEQVKATSPSKCVPLHKRNILPPTSISASHLLLQSALYVQTLRKLDKQRGQDTKKDKKSDRDKKHSGPSSHSHLRDHSAKPSKNKQSDQQAPKTEPMGPPKTVAKDGDFLLPGAPPPVRPRRQPQSITRQNGHQASKHVFGASKDKKPDRKSHKHGIDLRLAEMMEVDDISSSSGVVRKRVSLDMRQGEGVGKGSKLAQRHPTVTGTSKNADHMVVDDYSESSHDDSSEEGYDRELMESDQISIVGSPLTVTVRNERKRKADARPIPIWDVTGVLKRKPKAIEEAAPAGQGAPLNEGVTAEDLNRGEEVHRVAQEVLAMDQREEEKMAAKVADGDKKGNGKDLVNGTKDVEEGLMDEQNVGDEDRFEFSPPLRFKEFHGYGSQPAHQEVDGVVSATLLTQTMRGRAQRKARVESTASSQEEPSTSPLLLSQSQWSQSPPEPAAGSAVEEEGSHEASIRNVSPSPVRILSVHPSQGSLEGGDSVIVTLDRVEPSMKVVFGQVVAETIAHPTQAKLWATSPPSAVPLTVPLSILDGNRRRINNDSFYDFVYTQAKPN
jgi:hypothetical protein